MTESTLIGAPDLFRAVGLRPDGPAIVGRPTRAPGAGVYVIELTVPSARAMIDINRVGKWIERVDSLRLDGERPTAKALTTRLAAFWIPSATVLYIGSTDGSVASRITALDQHVLGDRRPHAAAHWLKTLSNSDLRVWWANTAATEEYEDALMTAFAEAVPPAERAALFDPAAVMPFANLRRGTGETKKHGIRGSVIAEEPVAPAPPTTVVVLPAAAADGVAPAKGSGTTRRTNAAPPRPAPVRPPRARAVSAASAAAARSRTAANAARSAPSASRSSPPRPPVEPILVTADGLARLQAELEELTRVKRPEVIARIRTARELGDLKENADYTSAREEQSFLEGRIQALEAMLRNVSVVEAAGGAARVALGSHVTAEIDGETVTFEIVDTSDSNPGAGRISSASPVGRAMVGRSVGDEAVVTTPRGEVRYLITVIE